MIEPSLPDLQEHITKFQAELRQMRQQFASRKAKLAALISRRAELLGQLQQVEAEMADQIAALAAEEEPATDGMVAASATGPAAVPMAAPKPAPPAKPAVRTNGVAPVESMSLRSVLTSILKMAKKPITSTELASRALAAGYKTTSSSLPKVVSTQLNKMDNIQHVKGEGYKLKH